RLASPSIRKRPEVNEATDHNPPRALSTSHPPLLSSSERAVVRPLEDPRCGLGSSTQTCPVPTGPRRYSKEGTTRRVAHCNSCRVSYQSPGSGECYALRDRVCNTPRLHPDFRRTPLSQSPPNSNSRTSRFPLPYLGRAVLRLVRRHVCTPSEVSRYPPPSSRSGESTSLE